MEMNPADENAEMQELCDEVCSDYLPECGGYSGPDPEFQGQNPKFRIRIGKLLKSAAVGPLRA